MVCASLSRGVSIYECSTSGNKDAMFSSLYTNRAVSQKPCGPKFTPMLGIFIFLFCASWVDENDLTVTLICISQTTDVKEMLTSLSVFIGLLYNIICKCWFTSFTHFNLVLGIFFLIFKSYFIFLIVIHFRLRIL